MVNGIKLAIVLSNIKWDKVFKNGPSKIGGSQPFKDLKRYGLLRQTIPIQKF